MARSRSRPRVRDTEVRSRKGRTSSSPGAPGQVRPWPQVHGLQKVQAPMPGWTMAPPRNVVKIAIQMRDAIPQLIQLDQVTRLVPPPSAPPPHLPVAPWPSGQPAPPLPPGSSPSLPAQAARMTTPLAGEAPGRCAEGGGA
ncbi:ELMO3 isoform 3 [Pongo abelii]|uniref:ELMO3 isoform 3 n=1 Tax=Pongo abelii TaxID=9601 RepID=A0A2J8VUN1_PONAB|nr:ELMO3 isoform 3 [Pongo abelii]